MNDESDFEIWSWNLSRAHCAVEGWENKLRFNLVNSIMNDINNIKQALIHSPLIIILESIAV